MPRRYRTAVQDLTAALRDGFSPASTRAVIVNNGVTQLFVEGFDEPIVVTTTGVVLPDVFKPLAPAIRLDVQTVLAERAGLLDAR